MDVQETRLQQVLEGQKQYRVPLYQRPYSWSIKQLDRLWADLTDLAAQRVEASQATHFTGSLVLSLGQIGPGGSEFLVVDGQQRLTTLSVLVAALRDHYLETEPENPAKVARLEESYLIDRFKTGDARLKLLPTQADRPAFRAIIDRNVASATASGLTEAYRFFRAKLRQADDPDDPHDIDRLESAALNGLVFVSITAKNEDNVYRIFESLNNTGLKLTQGDLLRNYLFMRLNQRGEEIYDSWWLPMQRALSPADLEALFWIDLVWRDPAVKQGDIYTMQVERMRHLAEDQIVDEVKRFSHLAQLMELIRNPSGEPDPAVRRGLQRNATWGLSATDALVLHLLRVRADGGSTNEETAQALHLVESFIIRRLIVGASPSPLSRILYRAPEEIGDTDVATSLHRYFSTGRKFFATDAQIADAVISKPFYYQGRPNQRKTLLAWLEEATPVAWRQRELMAKEQVDVERTTIEHIMPQTLSHAWRDALAGDLGPSETVDELHEELLHTLANLTLSGYNSELSNRSYAEKRDLLASSGLRMNGEIASRPSWTRRDILDRGAVVATRVASTWAAPIAETDISDSGVSWKLVVDLVDAIPTGRWASYGDIAAVAGTHPVPLGQFLASAPIPNAYRVLQAAGTVSPGFDWGDNAHAGRDVVEVLEEEGIEFDDAMRASQDQRMLVSELGEMIGLSVRSDTEPSDEEEEADRAAFINEFATRHTPSAVHGIVELLNAWEGLGGHLSFGSGQEVSCFLQAGRGPNRPKNIWPLVIYPYGSVEVVFQHLSTRPPFDEPELREELRMRLNEISGIDLGGDSIGKRPPFDTDILADRLARDQLVEVLTWFMSELGRFDAEFTEAT